MQRPPLDMQPEPKKPDPKKDLVKLCVTWQQGMAKRNVQIQQKFEEAHARGVPMSSDVMLQILRSDTVFFLNSIGAILQNLKDRDDAAEQTQNEGLLLPSHLRRQ